MARCGYLIYQNIKKTFFTNNEIVSIFWAPITHPTTGFHHVRRGFSSYVSGHVNRVALEIF